MTESQLHNTFSPWRIVVPVLMALLLISMWSQWYGRKVAVPRYCADTEQSLEYLHRILTRPRPAEDFPRRPYVVAAKLLFLIPKESDEPAEHYLERVASYLTETCQ